MPRGEGISLKALAVKELSLSARRAHNRALLSELPDLDVGTEEIVDIIREGREDRRS